MRVILLKLLKFELEVFDDGIGEDLFTDLFQFLTGQCRVRSGDFEFDDSADAGVGHTFHSLLVDGVLDGFALGIEHALFRGHNDGGFHKIGKVCYLRHHDGDGNLKRDPQTKTDSRRFTQIKIPSDTENTVFLFL